MFRPIQKGNQYDALIPKGACDKTFNGQGDTDFSIDKMVDCIDEYYLQLEKVAKLLEQPTLAQTCNAIFDFCYNHFQYKADGEDQFLRSPACSWHARYDGIDCKSYSILASCLLTNLNINHYIRKVNYTGEPNAFTHVYVIVPADQKTNNLKSGFYVIDGTLKENIELPYIEAKDEFMSLPHYTLNQPQLGSGPGTDGFGGTTTNSDASVTTTNPDGSSHTNYYQTIIGFFKNIKWSSISDFLQKLQCLGGIGFDQTSLNTGIQQVHDVVVNCVKKVNAAIGANDMAALQEADVEFVAYLEIMRTNVRLRHYGRFSNHCSDVNLDVISETYIPNIENNIYHGVFDAYLKQYFNVTDSTDTENFTLKATNLLGSWWNDSQVPDWSGSFGKRNFTLKPGVTTIPCFEFTDAVTALITTTPTPITIQTALGTLQTAVSTFTPAHAPGATTAGTTTPAGTLPAGAATATTAGMGILGWGLLGGTLLWMTGVLKFSPNGTTNKTKKDAK